MEFEEKIQMQFNFLNFTEYVNSQSTIFSWMEYSLMKILFVYSSPWMNHVKYSSNLQKNKQESI
jgi:hypothetical protein